MGELGEEHRREVTQHAEGASFGIHAGLQGETVNHSAWNGVENLLEDEHIGPGWWCFVHNTLPSGRDFNSTPAHFFARSYVFLWDGCRSNSKNFSQQFELYATLARIPETLIPSQIPLKLVPFTIDPNYFRSRTFGNETLKKILIPPRSRSCGVTLD